MAWFMGIDIGSRTTKGVIINDGKLKADHLFATGFDYEAAAQKLREELLAEAGLLPEDITSTVTTGCGNGVAFSDRHVADLRCCTKGIHHIFPLVRTVIDLQGQSSRVIRVSEKGQVTDFVASEKCAAGSGRFLDVIANVLQMELDDVGPLSLKSENPVAFTTGCAVFGESEVITRVSEGASKEDILAGIHNALADKISALVGRVGLEEQCAISGGGGLNIGLIRRLEEKLGVHLLVPPQPQLITALGAAIMAEAETPGRNNEV